MEAKRLTKAERHERYREASAAGARDRRPLGERQRKPSHTGGLTRGFHTQPRRKQS